MKRETGREKIQMIDLILKRTLFSSSLSLKVCMYNFSKENPAIFTHGKEHIRDPVKRSSWETGHFKRIKHCFETIIR